MRWRAARAARAACGGRARAGARARERAHGGDDGARAAPVVARVSHTGA